MRASTIATMLAASAVLTGPGTVFAAPDVRPTLICPSIFQPVCAQDGAATRTFANRCLAEGAGFAVIKTGRCGGKGDISQTSQGS